MSVGSKTLTLQFSNRGIIDAEDMFNKNPVVLDGRIVTLEQYIAMGAIDAKVRTCLMWGGTRKHHRDEYPDEDALDDLMEEIEANLNDQDAEKVLDNFLAPLIAAYNRTPLDKMKRIMKGEDPDEAPKAEKDQDKPARKPKPKAVKDSESAA